MDADGNETNIGSLRQRVDLLESALDRSTFVEVASFIRDGRLLRVHLTGRLRKAARKEGVWKSREFLVTLKNASYGFERKRSRSRGGQDGIFLLDRDWTPRNEMIRRLFDRYLDKPASGVDDVARKLGCARESLLPVRLVSHHLRLLGVLRQAEDCDDLVLVDCDRSEGQGR